MNQAIRNAQLLKHALETKTLNQVLNDLGYEDREEAAYEFANAICKLVDVLQENKLVDNFDVTDLTKFDANAWY